MTREEYETTYGSVKLTSRRLRALSVCSGIEAASVAWGCTAHARSGRLAAGESERAIIDVVAFAEIEPFPAAVLAARFPHVPNLGDMTMIDVAALPDVDILVGGTPCQSFSIAGKRLSLADARGNLALAYVALAHALQDQHGQITCLWENVPGVLTTDDNAFGCFVAALVGGRDPCPLPRGYERWPDHGMVAGPRGRLVWRLLDAQWFGVAQRRERVFVVASLGDDGPDPAAVLLEPAGLPGHRPPCVAAREDAARRAARPARPKSIWAAIADAVGERSWQSEFGNRYPEIAHTLTGNGHDASEDGTGRGTPLVAHALGASAGGVSGKGGAGLVPCPAIDPVGALGTQGPGGGWRLGADIRRLTVVECERLQGFPDNWTLIHEPEGAAWRTRKPEDRAETIAYLMGHGLGHNEAAALADCPDGPRYRALGNSMAVPVMRWIGRRIVAGLQRGTPRNINQISV